MKNISIDGLKKQSVRGQYSITIAGLLGISTAIYLYNQQNHRQCLDFIYKEVTRLLKQSETNNHPLSILYYFLARIYTRHEAIFSLAEQFLRKSVERNPYNIQSVKLLILHYTEGNRFDLIHHLISLDDYLYQKQMWEPVKMLLTYLYQSEQKGLTMARSLMNKVVTQPNKYQTLYFRPYFFYARIRYLRCEFQKCQIFLQKELQVQQDCVLTMQWLMRIAFLLQKYDRVEKYYLVKQNKGKLTFDDCVLYAACAIKKGEEQKAREIIGQIQVTSKYKMLNSLYFACYLGILYQLKMYEKVIVHEQDAQEKETYFEGEKLQILCILMHCYRKTRQFFQEKLVFSCLPEFQQNELIANPMQTAQQAISLAKYCFMQGQLIKGRYYVEIAQQTITYVREYNFQLSNKMARWLQSDDLVKGQLLLIFY